MRQKASLILCFYVFALLSNFPLVPAKDLMPWTWRVAPDSSNQPESFCPSTTQILGTFFAVNVFVSLFSLVVGNQSVLSFITCQFCGENDGRVTWFYMFIFPLGVNLGSSALIAYLYKTTPGFGDHFTIGELTLFYTTRPRLSWLVLVIFMEVDSFRIKGANYIKSAKSAVAAEMFLQVISSYYTGKTVHLAAQNNYYSHPGSAPSDARAMYAGALLSLVSLFFTLLSLIYILFADMKFDTIFFPILLIGCTSWLGSWLFWGGFVHLEIHGFDRNE